MVGRFTGYVQVHQKGYFDDQTLENSMQQNAEVEAAILAHPDIDLVIPRLESFALASSGDLSKGAGVVGIDPALEESFSEISRKVVEGDLFQKGEISALIGKDLGRQLQLGVGDTIVLIGQGYRGATAAGKYVVSGLLDFNSPDLNSRIVYLPLSEAQEMYGAYDLITTYALQLGRSDQGDRVVQDLETLLVDKGEYEALTWETMMPDMVQFIQADKGGNVLIMGILYLIVGFGIFGTVLMMTAERQYEFGIMVAIEMKILGSMIAGKIGSKPNSAYASAIESTRIGLMLKKRTRGKASPIPISTPSKEIRMVSMTMVRESLSFFIPIATMMPNSY
ncbi:MAG: ABC transporter permease [Bacteroidota bacterium]